MSGFTDKALEFLMLTKTGGLTRTKLKQFRRQFPRLTSLLETANLVCTDRFAATTEQTSSAGISQFLHLAVTLIDKDDARLVDDFLACCKDEILTDNPPTNSLAWSLLKTLLANTMDEGELIEALTATERQPTLKRRNAMGCDQWVSAHDEEEQKRQKVQVSE